MSESVVLVVPLEGVVEVADDNGLRLASAALLSVLTATTLVAVDLLLSTLFSMLARA